jgi:hypothetical protein
MEEPERVVELPRQTTSAIIGGLLTFALGFFWIDLVANLVTAGGTPEGFSTNPEVFWASVSIIPLVLVRTVMLLVDGVFGTRAFFYAQHAVIPRCSPFHLRRFRVRYEDVVELVWEAAPGANHNLSIRSHYGSRTVRGFIVGKKLGSIKSELQRRCPGV